MVGVISHPPQWAVQFIWMVPSDYVLADRFGTALDETTFLQAVENAILRGRQWYHDTTGGHTFNCLPTIYFRSSKTTAQLFAQFTDYYSASLYILGEVEAAGLIHRRSRHRINFSWLPLDMDGSDVSAFAFLGDGIGCPFVTPGDAVAVGTSIKNLGGVFPEFTGAPSTIAGAAGAGATTINVATGTGRNFAVAAKFHPYLVNSRVKFALDSTHLVLDSLDWLPSVLPVDAVMWPYGQKPTPANAECVQVTATNTGLTSVAIVRGRYGTTQIPVAAGGAAGGGTIIALRQKSARIWTSPASPEAGGAEVVSVESVGGDALTVLRGQADAYFLFGTTARALLAGDRIAPTESAARWYVLQKQDQAIGAAVHELGHIFGAKYYDPNASRAFRSTGPASGYVVSTTDRIATGNMPPNPSVDLVPGQDLWDLQPHTPDNPDTPGNFGPYLMINWSGFPFADGSGNPILPPAASFTAVELPRILASPHLAVQSRPTTANTAGAASFHTAGSSGGSGGGGTGYLVQPVAWWASDTATNTSVFPAVYGFTVPYPSAAFLAQMNTNVLTVRQWYWDHLDGYTFDALPSVLHTSARNTATIEADVTYHGGEFIHQSMIEADTALAAVDLTNIQRLHYLVTPCNGPTFGIGALGQTFGTGAPEGFTIAASPCHGPFICSQWGDRNTTLYGSAFGAPRPDGIGPTETDFASFIFAHELGHAFGYDPATSGLLPHDTSDFYNLMQANSGAGGLSHIGSLTAAQKLLMKASPFLTVHATRP